MAKVNVREFKSRLSYYLKLAQTELIEVTNWDKVIANVVTPQVNKDNQINLLKEYIVDLEERLRKYENNVVTETHNVVTTSEEKVFKQVGRCEKCRFYGTLSKQLVPMPNEIGDIVDVEMNLCSKCERNLNKVYS